MLCVPLKMMNKDYLRTLNLVLCVYPVVDMATEICKTAILVICIRIGAVSHTQLCSCATICRFVIFAKVRHWAKKQFLYIIRPKAS